MNIHCLVLDQRDGGIATPDGKQSDLQEAKTALENLKQSSTRILG